MENHNFWQRSVEVVAVAPCETWHENVCLAERIFGKIFEEGDSDYYGGKYFRGIYWGCEIYIRKNFEIDEVYDVRAPAEVILLHIDVDEVSEIDVVWLVAELEKVGFTYLE